METVLHRVRGSADLQSKHLLSSALLISLELLYSPLAAVTQQKPWARTEPMSFQLYSRCYVSADAGLHSRSFYSGCRIIQALARKTFALFPKESSLCCSHCLPTAHQLKTIKCTRHGKSLLPIGLPPTSSLVQSSYEDAASLAEKNPTKPQTPTPQKWKKASGKQTEAQKKSCDPLSPSFVCSTNHSTIIINLKT